ncbi:gene transfer agent family protein [Pelagibacterium lentulum]|uniref:Gene transfer agent family protein n=1 Tax=Pelagibacterium lentulum TaxID=2029865 RepID=A0A916RR27_9HYPH|nr:gene transfer agent family protein [Pelagibacterium lentulum]GGA63879.1 hypothetical protein GCM10011499_37850 [Pelagibacterium lentulum]
MTKFIEESFGGTKRKFCLGIGELRELQDITGVGPGTLLSRMLALQTAAETHKRPDPKTYPKGEADPDFLADHNVYALLRRMGGDWRVDDLRETIRLGLIGGGATPTDADVLMLRYFDQTDRYPLHGQVPLAAKIIIHAIAADPDDPVGKSQAETTVTPEAPTAE